MDGCLRRRPNISALRSPSGSSQPLLRSQCDGVHSPNLQFTIVPQDKEPEANEGQPKRLGASKRRLKWSARQLASIRCIPGPLPKISLRNEPQKHHNAVFRSNSFRFEKCQTSKVLRGLSVRKQLQHCEENIAVCDNYESPKDYVNRQPLPVITTKEPKDLMVPSHVIYARNPSLDVVYADPKDSKLYKTPGIDPQDEIIYKLYVGGEAKYCRPFINGGFLPKAPIEISSTDYEDVVAQDCVTMIAVMPSDGVQSAPVSPVPTEERESTATPTTLESESSSEVGSFTIDVPKQTSMLSPQAQAFYENLDFHKASLEAGHHELLLAKSKMIQSKLNNSTAAAVHTNKGFVKFGYSRKEVWNWLYTDYDYNHNSSQSVNHNNKTLEVRFTVQEFLDAYKRIAHINLEGIDQLILKTLDGNNKKQNNNNKNQDKPRQHFNPCLVHNTNTMMAGGGRQQACKIGSCSKEKRKQFELNQAYIKLPFKQVEDPVKRVFLCSAENMPYETLDVYGLNKFQDPCHFAAATTAVMSVTSQPKIDVSIPLDRQEWYHGAITRVEAENVLRLHKEGSFLVRNSESSSKDFSLSVKSARGFMHMKIQGHVGGGYILGQFSKPFENVPQMVLFYTINRLPVRGAEHVSLQHPICEQLL